MIFLYVQIDYKDQTPDYVKEHIASILRKHQFEFDVWELSDSVVPFVECESLVDAGRVTQMIKDEIIDIKDIVDIMEWPRNIEVMVVSHKEKLL